MSRDGGGAAIALWHRHHPEQHDPREDDGAAPRPARPQHLDEVQPADDELEEELWAHLAAAHGQAVVVEGDEDEFGVQLEGLRHIAPGQAQQGNRAAGQLVQPVQANEDELPSSLADWIDNNWDADKASTLSGEEEVRRALCC